MTRAILYASHEPDPKDVEALFADVENVFAGYTITEPFAEGYTGRVEPIDHAMQKRLGEWAFEANQQRMYKALGEITGRSESV